MYCVRHWNKSQSNNDPRVEGGNSGSCTSSVTLWVISCSVLSLKPSPLSHLYSLPIPTPGHPNSTVVADHLHPYPPSSSRPFLLTQEVKAAAGSQESGFLSHSSKKRKIKKKKTKPKISFLLPQGLEHNKGLIPQKLKAQELQKHKVWIFTSHRSMKVSHSPCGN